MKNLRRVASLLAVAPLAITGLVMSTGAASAAVVVPPGKSGSTCSGYKYADSLHQRYWQTCAWADHQYVWFTVNFGNSSDVSWNPSSTVWSYIKAGRPGACVKAHEEFFEVKAHDTTGTERIKCVLTRVPGAYASVGKVSYTSSTGYVEQHSPTLQVQ